MDRPAPTWRRTLLSFLFMFGVMLICIAITGFTLDQTCVAQLQERIPPYPGATLISERHSLLRAYGMGETVAIWQSTDAAKTVNEWYGKQYAAAVRGARTGLARSNWTVSTNPDGSTQIILYGNCVT